MTNPYLRESSRATYDRILARYKARGSPGPVEYARELWESFSYATARLHLTVLKQSLPGFADIKYPRRTANSEDGILCRSLAPAESLALYRHTLTASLPDSVRLAILLMLTDGLRIGEVASLTWDQIGTQHLTIIGKGGKLRVIPLRPEIADCIAGFPAPVNKGGKVLSVGIRSLQLSVNAVLSQLGLKRPGITAHSLRHSFAVLARLSGASLEALSSHLGHSSITTTQIYSKSAGKWSDNPADLVSNAFGSQIKKLEESTNDAKAICGNEGKS